MGDSISSYWDDREAEEARELAAKQKTVEYWRERALNAENRLREVHAASSVLKGFNNNRLTFDPVYGDDK